MAAITIRNLDDSAKEQLRVRAAQNGRSMEAEARAILEAAVANPYAGLNIAQAFRKLALEAGGLDDLEIPSREAGSKKPIVFSEEWERERAEYIDGLEKKRSKKSKNAA
jgi:plasmid stability protein